MTSMIQMTFSYSWSLNCKIVKTFTEDLIIMMGQQIETYCGHLILTNSQETPFGRTNTETTENSREIKSQTRQPVNEPKEYSKANIRCVASSHT